MSTLKQIRYMSAVYLISLSIGFTSITSSKENSDAEHSSSLSWGGIFTILGYLTSSLLMDTIGRKKTYILGIIPGIFSSLLMNFSWKPIEVIGSALNGLFFGCTFILGLVIIGEYTSPKHRSVFLTISVASVNIGQVLGKLHNHFEWTTAANLPLTFQILSLGIVWIWPKSPYWLALTGQYEDYETYFDQLRGIDEESSREKKELLNRNIQERTLTGKILGTCKMFFRTELTTPVTIILCGAILAEASGKNYLQLFAQNSTINGVSTLQNVFLSIIIAFSSIFSCILLGTYGNRKLLVTTGAASVIALFFGSICVLFEIHQVVSPENSWVYIILMVLHVIFSNLGSTTIPTAVIGELFPLEYKAIGAFAAGLVTSAVSWSAMKIASGLVATFHVYGTLATFGLVMTLCLLIMWVILPETKGRTLVDISDYFVNGWFVEDESDDEERLT